MPIYGSGAYLGTLSGGGTATPVASHRVIVNSDADLPELTGGYSELEANTEYFFQTFVSSKPLKANQPGVSFLGTGPFALGVQYTGTLPWLTVDNVSVSIDKLAVKSNTASKFFEAGGTGINTLFTDTVEVQGNIPLGDLDGISLVCNNFVALGFSRGFKFSSLASDIRGMSFVNGFMVDQGVGAGTHFDLDDAVFEDLEILNMIMEGGGTCISSSVGGTGNMVLGVEADVANTTFGKSGFMTPLSGFTNDFQTNQWEFINNSPTDSVEPTRYFCDEYMELVGATTDITVAVATQNVFYEVGTPNALEAVFQSDIEQHFVGNSDGSVTYTGDKVIDGEVIGSVTAERAGGGSGQLEARIAINWTPGSTGLSKSRSTTRNTSPTLMNPTAAVVISPNDRISIIMRNTSSDADIILETYKIDIGGR